MWEPAAIASILAARTFSTWASAGVVVVSIPTCADGATWCHNRLGARGSVGGAGCLRELANRSTAQEQVAHQIATSSDTGICPGGGRESCSVTVTKILPGDGQGICSRRV